MASNIGEKSGSPKRVLSNGLCRIGAAALLLQGRHGVPRLDDDQLAVPVVVVDLALGDLVEPRPDEPADVGVLDAQRDLRDWSR